MTKFKGRHRNPVMGKGYTEMFFLDEVSALASGHRPCFECQRTRANDFANRWAVVEGFSDRANADPMDRVLHHERLANRQINNKPLELPNGSMVMDQAEQCFAVKDNTLLLWSGYGYKFGIEPEGTCHLLTPKTIVAILKNGYKPHWHNSASMNG